MVAWRRESVTACESVGVVDMSMSSARLLGLCDASHLPAGPITMPVNSRNHSNSLDDVETDLHMYAISSATVRSASGDN